MRTRCLEAPGRDRFGMAGARLLSSPGERWLGPPAWGGDDYLQRRDRREMTLELAEVVAAWPLGASLAAAVALGGLREGRRRTALNEALHELRRPLQALALVAPATGRLEPAAIQGSVQMAATALERLQREVNGEALAPVREPTPVRPLAVSVVGRWKGRAALAGGSLSLRWQAGEAAIDGDREALAGALDNLVVNAIEHGGPAIVVEARTDSGKLRLAVIDSGREARPLGRRETPAELVARLSGRRLHGHGLRVVRRTAAAHGGDFRLCGCPRRTEAILELPLAAASGHSA
ncbi:MAG: qseC2 [Solirubrobacterales bacterium]|nr:qseC2 [Solirubrobacterales bacterium]